MAGKTLKTLSKIRNVQRNGTVFKENHDHDVFQDSNKLRHEHTCSCDRAVDVCSYTRCSRVRSRERQGEGEGEGLVSDAEPVQDTQCDQESAGGSSTCIGAAGAHVHPQLSQVARAREGHGDDHSDALGRRVSEKMSFEALY